MTAAADRERIVVRLSPEAKRRVRVRAAEHESSMSTYLGWLAEIDAGIRMPGCHHIEPCDPQYASGPDKCSPPGGQA